MNWRPTSASEGPKQPAPHFAIGPALPSGVYPRIGAGRHSHMPTERDAEGACRAIADALRNVRRGNILAKEFLRQRHAPAGRVFPSGPRQPPSGNDRTRSNGTWQHPARVFPPSCCDLDPRESGARSVPAADRPYRAGDGAGPRRLPLNAKLRSTATPTTGEAPSHGRSGRLSFRRLSSRPASSAALRPGRG